MGESRSSSSSAARLRFSVQLESAKRARLQISSRLLAGGAQRLLQNRQNTAESRARAPWLGLVLALPCSAWAQSSLPDLSLEDLMKLDAGQVFGASERLQPVTEAPASVSFITAEEIARYGYRTLADILRGVRGMYVDATIATSASSGRAGSRKPGDYNSRILLLVNGHRVNDNVFGQAEIGAEFGLDPAMFERVEIIRGPASSLYGDSAFFAVVNVITRTGRVARRRLDDARGRHAGDPAGAGQRRATASRTAWMWRCRAPSSAATASAGSTFRRSIRRPPTTAWPRGSTAKASGSSTAGWPSRA